MTSQINGENNLAGEAALSRVDAAVQQKQSQDAGSAGSQAPSGSSGYSVVQNLMASLDDITINNGSAPPATIGSSTAANGYSATQNLLTSLDNITINNGQSGLLPGANAPDALMGVDSIISPHESERQGVARPKSSHSEIGASARAPRARSLTPSSLPHSAGPASEAISQPLGSTSSVVGMPIALPTVLRSWNTLALASE